MSDLSMYDQATPNASRTSDHKIIQQSTKGTPVPTSHPKRFNKSTIAAILFYRTRLLSSVTILLIEVNRGPIDFSH